MKRLSAIWFCLLLAWMQIASAAAVSRTTVCAKPVVDCCANCSPGMACCAAKPASDAQPAPVVPVPANDHSQISVPALTIMAWVLPGNGANLFSATSVPPMTAASAPLYARHCALLL